MKYLAPILLCALLVSSPAAAQQQPVDSQLTEFRQAYTTGDGLAYVVIKTKEGEKLYRYGDASRLTAKKDTRGYMLFTCARPHVFLQGKAEDKAALATAEVVNQGQTRFAELDAKYLSGCRNPLVKSAVPKN